LQIKWQGRFEAEKLAGDGVTELQFGGVQKDSGRLLWLRATIEVIACDWMPNGGQMHANLVRAPGDNLHPQQGEVGKFAFDPEQRLRVATMLGGDGHALPVALVAPDGRFNSPFGQGHAPFHQRDIALGDAVFLKLLRKAQHGLGCFGDDQQARCIFIETMHNARTMLAAWADGLDHVWVAGQQGICQGVTFVACGGMYDQARRFVEDDQLVILKKNF
jgi:hypothetical protein